MNIADIRTALANQLSPVVRCRAYVPDSLNPPEGFIRPVSALPVDVDGGQQITLAVIVAVSRANARSAQASLDDFLSGGALRTALESDPTLGGTVDDARWAGWENYAATYEIADIGYLAVQVNVEVVG